MNNYKTIFIIAAMMIFFGGTTLHANNEAPTLPSSIQSQAHTALNQVGNGTYRKWGFRVYNATLWAKDGEWNPDQPYALQLKYTRDVSKDTLVDTVIDDIREQNVADDATINHWQETLNQELPDVKENDDLTGLCLPGKKSLLFYNGKQIASIDDQQLSKAFFNIWLGKTADENLKANLLGQSQNDRP